MLAGSIELVWPELHPDNMNGLWISVIRRYMQHGYSNAVGPILGLTPKLNETGEIKRIGQISCCGDNMVRSLLYDTAQTLLTRVKKWSWLKA
jgi:transposase